MFVWLYALALVGSCSVGYSLLRLIYPEKQSASIGEKIGYSYGIGLIVFLPGIISIVMLGDKLFFIGSGAVYLVLFIAFYAKRKASGLADNEELVVQKTKRFIPTRVLTDEEKASQKQEQTNNYANNTPTPKDLNKTSNNKTSNNNISNNDNTNHRKTNFGELKVVNSGEIKEQLFKEKQPNVIAKLREKTLNVETQKKEDERKASLARLKELAKQVNKKNITEKKNVDEKTEDINENELNDIGDNFK